MSGDTTHKVPGATTKVVEDVEDGEVDAPTVAADSDAARCERGERQQQLAAAFAVVLDHPELTEDL